jgi:hypothetical protein
MDKTNIKDIHSQLEKLTNQKLPNWVSNRISNLIPAKSESGEEVYIYTNLIFTMGELISNLTLLDKQYESRIHTYGTIENLLFSYHDFKPGLMLDHRVRNPKNGMFVQKRTSFEPIKSPEESNIFLIQTKEWDSYKYDGVRESYTILVYNHNNEIEKQRLANAEQAIKKLQDEYSQTMGGPKNNGDQSNDGGQ